LSHKSGPDVGAAVGANVGAVVGAAVGAAVGANVGAAVGAAVGAHPHSPKFSTTLLLVKSLINVSSWRLKNSLGAIY